MCTLMVFTTMVIPVANNHVRLVCFAFLHEKFVMGRVL